MNFFYSLLSSVGILSGHSDHVTIKGRDPILPSPFPLGEAGAAALAAVGYVAAELWQMKTQKTQTVSIDVQEAAIVQRSHEYIRAIEGGNEALWSPISGFYQTQDERWIQLHCNFPHHQEGVISLLTCENNPDSVAHAVKKWNALTLETELAERGLCAAMVRTPEEWHNHPHAQAINTLPLMEIIKIGESCPEPLPEGNRPLSGIHVLDLTRVIAGPVCGKSLAEQGATVLHITSPKLPSILPLVMDTGFGKYSTYLDLEQTEEKNKLTQLIKKADIFSQSYRPEGMAEKGFSYQECARIRPGLIYISFSAYSHVGPWAKRHGYDSLVQSATGIVHEQTTGPTPKHLPAQSLDYITGFLAAFGAMEALKRRALEGGSYVVRVSLAQTAQWLKQLPRVTDDFADCKIPTREDIASLLTRESSGFGILEHVPPVLKMSETMPHFKQPSVPLGTHPPLWPHTKLS